MIAVFLSVMLGADPGSSSSVSAWRWPCSWTRPSSGWCCCPASMELLGRLNWWLPRWLDRVLPTVRLEAEPAPRAGRGEAAPVEGWTKGAAECVRPGR